MIWDFRGPSAAKTAKHHAQHLKEYATIEKLHCLRKSQVWKKAECQFGNEDRSSC